MTRMKPLSCLFALALAGDAAAVATVGEPAPDFTLSDSHGKPHRLSDYAGHTVVLEWTNPECPFVGKHYRVDNIPGQQRAATADDVVWLTINSSGPGLEGHLEADQVAAARAPFKVAENAYLLDSDGTVGHLYGAKATPNMFVVDAGGVLRYAGAIDSIASTDPADIARATQYVPQALAELAAGRAVSVPVTRPYGCSVKYRR